MVERLEIAAGSVRFKDNGKVEVTTPTIRNGGPKIRPVKIIGEVSDFSAETQEQIRTIRNQAKSDAIHVNANGDIVVAL